MYRSTKKDHTGQENTNCISVALEKTIGYERSIKS